MKRTQQTAARRATTWLAASALLATVACSKTPGKSADKIPRESNEPPVVFVDPPDPTKVEFSDESEPNDELAQASTLAVGKGARGTLNGEVDRDVYKVVIDRPGAVQAHLSGIDKVDLILELLDEQGQLLAASDRGPALTVEGIANFAVSAGMYHLRVREFVKKRKKKKRKRRKKKKKDEPEPTGRTDLSPVYQLVVSVAEQNQPRHEIEDNRSRETATEILLGDETTGFIGWSRDVDVWKLSTEGFTAQYGVDIDLSGVGGVTMELHILDANGKLVLKRKGTRGEGLAVRNMVVVKDDETTGDDGDERGGTKPDGETASGVPGTEFYYARIKARRSHPEEPYRLRMSTRLMDLDEEMEPNDSLEQAMPLAILALGASGLTRAHLTWGDSDQFTVPAFPEPGLLTVEASPTGEVDVELSVVQAGSTLGSSNAGGRGETERLSGLRIEAGLVAVIAVSGKGSDPGDARYDLKWSLEPAGGAPLDGDDLDGADDGADDVGNDDSGSGMLDDEYGDE